jgi:hypothetical protein
MSPTADKLHDPKSASRFLGGYNCPVSPSDLARMRLEGGGPPFLRWRAKHIRYPERELLDWAAANLRAAYRRARSPSPRATPCGGCPPRGAQP